MSAHGYKPIRCITERNVSFNYKSSYSLVILEVIFCVYVCVCVRFVLVCRLLTYPYRHKYVTINTKETHLLNFLLRTEMTFDPFQASSRSSPQHDPPLLLLRQRDWWLCSPSQRVMALHLHFLISSNGAAGWDLTR